MMDDMDELKFKGVPELIQPEYSDWECSLFGAKLGEGISWRPLKGKEPNWFWLWIQYLFFGNRWIKKSKWDAQWRPIGGSDPDTV